MEALFDSCGIIELVCEIRHQFQAFSGFMLFSAPKKNPIPAPVTLTVGQNKKMNSIHVSQSSSRWKICLKMYYLKLAILVYVCSTLS